MTHNRDHESRPEGWTDETEFHLPDDHWPLPELVHTEAPHEAPTTASFVAVSTSPEYTTLRSTFRRFAFPMTVAGLVSYFLYVLLSIYATDFMGTKVFGNITWGLIIGLGQFVSTFLITFLYIRFANREIDPRAEAIRLELEGEAV